MKKFKPLDVILFAQFILFLVLWAVDEDTGICCAVLCQSISQIKRKKLNLADASGISEDVLFWHNSDCQFLESWQLFRSSNAFRLHACIYS